MKNFAAALAASSLLLAAPAMANPAARLSVAASVDRASAEQQGESELMDSGFIGVAIVFGLGAAAGALIYSLITGGDEEEPASP